jgi:hypothetical protein
MLGQESILKAKKGGEVIMMIANVGSEGPPCGTCHIGQV